MASTFFQHYLNITAYKIRTCGIVGDRFAEDSVPPGETKELVSLHRFCFRAVRRTGSFNNAKFHRSEVETREQTPNDPTLTRARGGCKRVSVVLRRCRGSPLIVRTGALQVPRVTNCLQWMVVTRSDRSGICYPEIARIFSATLALLTFDVSRVPFDLLLPPAPSWLKRISPTFGCEFRAIS